VAKNLCEKVRLQYGAEAQNALIANIRDLEAELKHKDEVLNLERTNHSKVDEAQRQTLRAQQETIKAQQMALLMATRRMDQ
jgi:thymidylate kinase